MKAGETTGTNRMPSELDPRGAVAKEILGRLGRMRWDVQKVNEMIDGIWANADWID